MTLTESRSSVSVEWEKRLAIVVDTMRDMSRQTDPQEMVRAYARRMRTIYADDHFLALSRRELEFPNYRITRSSLWQESINPWKEKHRLPLLNGGLLGELLYADEPIIIDDLQFMSDDPAAEYLHGMRSLAAIPNYDQGVALNMTVRMSERPAAFDREEFPELVWISNLFGRAAHNLVLAEDVKHAYDILDRELKSVGQMQRSLLPIEMPRIPTMELAAHYQTAHRAGGDYYDFFPLPDGKWAILIADVSGHGTPAAVVMAITHSIAHSYPGPPSPADKMLNYVNYQLTTRYTSSLGAFVTAFYGIYDPANRLLTYASAGHNPPRLKRCADGTIISLDGVGGLPLGVSADETYEECVQTLYPGDQIVFYTDGITEAQNVSGALFGLERLDSAITQCRQDANELIAAVRCEVESFAAGHPANDDQTLLVAKIR